MPPWDSSNTFKLGMRDLLFRNIIQFRCLLSYPDKTKDFPFKWGVFDWSDGQIRSRTINVQALVRATHCNRDLSRVTQKPFCEG